MQSIELETYFEIARAWFERTGKRLYQVNNPGLSSEFGTLSDIKCYVARRYGEADPEMLARQYIDESLEASNAAWMA